jgi:hypothetical protein
MVTTQAACAPLTGAGVGVGVGVAPVGVGVGVTSGVGVGLPGVGVGVALPGVGVGVALPLGPRNGAAGVEELLQALTAAAATKSPIVMSARIFKRSGCRFSMVKHQQFQRRSLESKRQV